MVASFKMRRAPAARRAQRQQRFGAALFSLVVTAASCGFPEYEFLPSGAAGGATQAGAAGLAGTAPSGGAGMPSVAAGAAGAPEGGVTGGGGEPAACGPSAPVRPDSCYDGELTGDETDVDCGGGECQPCFEGACVVDGDCASGGCVGLACSPRFRLEFQADDLLRSTAKLNFQVRFTYESGTSPVPLERLSVRYYFARNGVLEPITVGSSNATVTQSGNAFDLKPDTAWKLNKINRGPADAYDIYLEVRFTGPQSLVPGDSVHFAQEINPGNTTQAFDQDTHYSFGAVTFQEWKRITLYEDEELVWGYEPRGGERPSCLLRAVDLNGPAVTIDGQGWESAASATVTTEGSAFAQSAAIYPSVSGGLSTMLHSGYTLGDGQGVHVPLENGDYLLYAYGFSANSYGLSTLNVEDEAVDAFYMSWLYGVQSWGKLGPYPVTVADGVLDLVSAGGDLALSGVEIRTPADASY